MDGYRSIERLTGVYHADGGWRGEIAYVVGKVAGTAHCALCDITHSVVRRKPAWDQMAADLGVPFDLVHLNERDPQLLAVTEGGTPCVVAHTADALVVVLGPAELEEIGGDVDAFAAALRAALTREGLRPGMI